MSAPAIEPLLSVEDPQDGVALITLRRPERLNALSWELVDELRGALARLARRREVRVVVLTGAGRGFCSGLDIGSDRAFGEDDGVVAVLDRQERVAGLAVALRELPQPVVAAVNGPAAGGGLALALACDVRVCSPSARFDVAFVRVGLSGCDVGVSYLLPRIVGLGRASELMLTGRSVDALEAERIGLANHVAADGEVVTAALELAGSIVRNSPFGVRMTKQVLAQAVDAPSLRAAVELENRTQALAVATRDAPEALAAFRQRRAPSFEGR